MERSNKKYDTRDLKVAATFIADDIGLEIILKPAQVIQDTHQGTWGRMPGTGLTRHFKGGRHVCYNKAELEMILVSDAFKNGVIRRDPEDPTEFWRQLGIVKEHMIPVAIGKGTTLKIKFEDLDLTLLKKPEKEAVPLSQVV